MNKIFIKITLTFLLIIGLSLGGFASISQPIVAHADSISEMNKCLAAGRYYTVVGGKGVCQDYDFQVGNGDEIRKTMPTVNNYKTSAGYTMFTSYLGRIVSAVSYIGYLLLIFYLILSGLELMREKKNGNIIQTLAKKTKMTNAIYAFLLFGLMPLITGVGLDFKNTFHTASSSPRSFINSDLSVGDDTIKFSEDFIISKSYLETYLVSNPTAFNETGLSTAKTMTTIKDGDTSTTQSGFADLVLNKILGNLVAFVYFLIKKVIDIVGGVAFAPIAFNADFYGYAATAKAGTLQSIINNYFPTDDTLVKSMLNVLQKFTISLNALYYVMKQICIMCIDLVCYYYGIMLATGMTKITIDKFFRNFITGLIGMVLAPSIIQIILDFDIIMSTLIFSMASKAFPGYVFMSILPGADEFIGKSPQLLTIIMMCVVAIFVLMLTVVFFKRRIEISILYVFSPLVFLSYMLPSGNGSTAVNKWLKSVASAAFLSTLYAPMFVITVSILKLAETTSGDFATTILFYIFAVALMFGMLKFQSTLMGMLPFIDPHSASVKSMNEALNKVSSKEFYKSGIDKTAAVSALGGAAVGGAAAVAYEKLQNRRERMQTNTERLNDGDSRIISFDNVRRGLDVGHETTAAGDVSAADISNLPFPVEGPSNIQADEASIMDSIGQTPGNDSIAAQNAEVGITAPVATSGINPRTPSIAEENPTAAPLNVANGQPQQVADANQQQQADQNSGGTFANGEALPADVERKKGLLYYKGTNDRFYSPKEGDVLNEKNKFDSKAKERQDSMDSAKKRYFDQQTAAGRMKHDMKDKMKGVADAFGIKGSGTAGKLFTIATLGMAPNVGKLAKWSGEKVANTEAGKAVTNAVSGKMRDFSNAVSRRSPKAQESILNARRYGTILDNIGNIENKNTDRVTQINNIRNSEDFIRFKEAEMNFSSSQANLNDLVGENESFGTKGMSEDAFNQFVASEEFGGKMDALRNDTIALNNRLQTDELADEDIYAMSETVLNNNNILANYEQMRSSRSEIDSRADVFKNSESQIEALNAQIKADEEKIKTYQKEERSILDREDEKNRKTFHQYTKKTYERIQREKETEEKMEAAKNAAAQRAASASGDSLSKREQNRVQRNTKRYSDEYLDNKKSSWSTFNENNHYDS